MGRNSRKKGSTCALKPVCSSIEISLKLRPLDCLGNKVEKEAQQTLFRRENHDLRDDLDASFSQVQEQLDDHRSTLNEHTNEIETSYELMNQLALKIDKLQQRLDELTMLVRHGKPVDNVAFAIQPLTPAEKEVFFALYTLTETTPFVTYHQLAKKIANTVEVVSRQLNMLISKGVPVEKKYSNGNAFLGLDKQFRQMQAKQNIVKLDTKLTYWANTQTA